MSGDLRQLQCVVIRESRRGIQATKTASPTLGENAKVVCIRKNSAPEALNSALNSTRSPCDVQSHASVDRASAQSIEPQLVHADDPLTVFLDMALEQRLLCHTRLHALQHCLRTLYLCMCLRVLLISLGGDDVLSWGTVPAKFATRPIFRFPERFRPK